MYCRKNVTLWYQMSHASAMKLIRNITGFFRRKENETHLRMAGRIAMKAIEWISNLVIAAFLLFVLWITLQITSYATFRIPTYSMEPTIKAGDHVLVCKWVMGGRWFNMFDAVADRPIDIKRLPGFGSLKRGDIFSFNYPYRDGFDSIKMDIAIYYMKRCVGIPGDTLEIRDCIYRINGKEEDLGILSEQRWLNKRILMGEKRGEDVMKQYCMEAYPLGGQKGWTIQNFGPMIIPARGTRIAVTRDNAEIYRRLIEWETSQRMAWGEDSTITLGGKPLTEYTFCENYYFAAGDNCSDSHDSRYFGPIPEPFVVGKAVLIWGSKDSRGHRRKGRQFLPIRSVKHD